MNKFERLAGFCIGLAALVAIFTVLPSQIQAQTFYGSISGTITDATGAVIPNAAVTATNIGTAEKHTVKTNAAGEFRILTLVPATYKVEVTAANFKRFVQDIVTVQVDTVTPLNASLQVGAADQTIEVSTETPLLQTESGTVSTQVQGETVTEMPLNGRNVMNLIATTPGVIPGNNSMGSTGMNSGNHTDIVGFNNYSVGGGQPGYTSDYVDGAPDNILSQNVTGFIPTQDAVQEFKVASNSVTAEYGRFGGGVVAMTTKSGANKFHGTIYEYLRNTKLNANAFFNGAAFQGGTALPTAKWNQNQYGTEVDGPIVRNKAFFMFSWEDYSQRTANPGNTNVPGDGTHGTTNMGGYATGGNTPGVADAVFSAIDPLGNTRTITDPSGNCPNITFNAVANTYTIPHTCFDPTGAVLLGFWGKPNNTSSSSNPHNFDVSPELGNDTSQYNGRVDYKLGNNQNLFARYTFWKLDDIGEAPMANTTATIPSGFASTHVHAHSAVLGDTYTVSNNTVADVRLSYLRQVFTNISNEYNSTNYAKFGGAYTTLGPQFTFQSQPNVNLIGNDNIQFVIPQAGVQLEKSDFYSINANLTRIFGNHATKFGVEGRLSQRNSVGNNPDYAGFSFFFNGGVPWAAGDEIASLELGTFFFSQINTVLPTTTYNYSYAAYATDDWKIGRNLTVNLGIRWELPGGMEEKKDRTAVLLPSLADPNTGYVGTMALVNSTYYPSRSMEPPRYDLFSPRASFAERLGSASVVRGGASLLILPPDLAGGTQAFFSPVAGVQTTNTNLPIPGSTHYFESNPFPTSSPILQPQGRKLTTLGQYLFGQYVQGPLPGTNYPYVLQYNLAVSRQWRGGWTTEIAGVGAHGTHLPIGSSSGTPDASNFEMDQIPDQDFQYSAALTAADTAANHGNYTAGFAATTGSNAGQDLNANTACAGNPHNSVGQCLRPYPQFKGYSNYAYNAGSSTYSAMYVTVQKRFSGGGVLNANYFWFKSIDDVGPGQWIDFYNKAQARTLSNFDVDQRANISYVIDLPFGKGKRWANDAHGVAGVLISGWAANGITTLQAGSPLTFQSQSNTVSSSLVGESQAPNPFTSFVSGCNPKGSGSAFQKVVNQSWFNKTCFVNAASSAAYPNPFGNMKANFGGVRGEGIRNFDFSLLKATQITERATFQFRAEVFNLFNHPQFRNPGSTIGGGGFSGGYDQITQTNNSPRLIQIGARIKF